MKEQGINKKAQIVIEASNGYVIKTIVTNKAGTNDTLACVNGRFCSLEGKVVGKKATELQVAHQIKVIKAGGLAVTFSSLKDVLQVIEWAVSGYIQPLPEKQLKIFTL